MTERTKIYIALALAAALAAAMLASSAWSSYKITKLETEAANLKRVIAEKDRDANAKAVEAAAFKEKIEFLESQLAEIQTIAKKQDEELNKITDNTARVRRDVDIARRTRSVTADAEQLCAKLAELGHPCG